MSAIDTLPQDFVAQIQAIYTQEQQHKIWDSFTGKQFTGFRINTLKWSLAEANTALAELGFDAQAVAWCPEARVIPVAQRDKLIASDLFNDGRIYVQNLSSMLAPVALAAQPGETVLDLAAAPGGKTTMIAAHMQNEGVLSAVEPVKGRFFKLKSILETAGVEIAKCYMMDGRAVGNKTPERFDKILLDAPCSSEARFTINDPKSWEHWNMRKVKECSKKQKRLLLAAFHALKPGAEMVYCTCSFSPEENELPVAALIKKYPDAVDVMPIDIAIDNRSNGITEWNGKTLPASLKHSIRVVPDSLIDGFYLCRIRKTQSV